MVNESIESKTSLKVFIYMYADFARMFRMCISGRPAGCSEAQIKQPLTLSLT